MSKPIEVWFVDSPTHGLIQCDDERDAKLTEKQLPAKDPGARVVHLREVVTCGECEHGILDPGGLPSTPLMICRLTFYDNHHEPNWFCPHGERRA